MKEVLKKGIRIWANSFLPKPVWIIWHATRQKVDIGLTHEEARYLFKEVKKTKGNIAEVGVWTGGSAKIICEAKKDRPLYLFDTFEGIPEVEKDDDFKIGQFKNTSFEKVNKYLLEYPNVYIYKGIFPKTTKDVKDKKFGFVHLDVDTYQSTKDCLEYFYPKMNGIILIHDYYAAKGVKKAVDEFGKPIIKGVGSQCKIICQKIGQSQ